MKLVAIAAGGALGALARYGAGLVIGSSPGSFPWPTFAVNISGSFVAGVLASVFAAHANGLASAGLVIGFLGAFTTFSAFAVQAEGLLGDQAPLALAYVASSVVLGIAAAWAGLAVGRGV